VLSNNPTTINAEPGKQELFITREFDAPRDLVFRAHSEVDLIVQWIGPRGLTTRYEIFEPRTNGAYRFIQTDANANEYAFRGVTHEVLPNERVIQTFEFESLPESGHVVLEVIRFEELPNNRSRVLTQSVFLSVEDRDGMIAAGMEYGVNEGNQRLDELLVSLASNAPANRCCGAP
jgi:uncharacterized protein YndB with AHSA1/START domain